MVSNDVSLGRVSLVGTTVKRVERLPKDLVVDEKHSWLLGEKIYLPTVVGGGVFLGVGVTNKADAADLEAGYGEFKTEVRVRDPKNHHRWACFFTTQSSLSALTILQTIAGRWSLEVAFYEAKQYLGIEHTQSRLPKAVNRLFPIGMRLLSLVKFWFITSGIHTSFAKVSCNPGIIRKPNPRFPIWWLLCAALEGPTDFIQPLLLPMSCIKLFSS